MKYRISVTLNGKTVVVFAEKGNLYQILTNNSLICSPCGGNQQCGQCKIRADIPATENEKKILTSNELSSNIRLACFHKIEKDLSLVIENPRSNIKMVSDSTLRIDNIDPIVCKKPISVEKNHNFPSDKEYLEHLLKAKIGNQLLKSIPDAMLEKIIDAVVSGSSVVSLSGKNPLLLAIDLGTTTIAGKLFDTGGNMIAQANIANSQRKYGYDIISRMRYATKNPEHLKETVIKDIDTLVTKLSAKSKPSDKIVYVCIAANSAMTHLAYGIPTDRLAVFPYKNIITTLKTNAAEMGIRSLDKATIIQFAPLIDAYIGGDITADLVALSEKRNFLLLDIGTNCEVVLNKDGELWATSAPSGPAFEGGNIECGMTATRGAITRIELSEEDDIKVDTIGNAPAVGIAGSGVISIVSQLIKWNIIDKYGRFLEPYEIDSELSPKIIKRIKKNDKDIKSLFLDYEHSVYLSQSDIEQFIFAKAALTSAIDVLFECSKASWPELSVIVAGGFGYYISEEDLIRTGIISEPAKSISIVGNAALTGAAKMLLSKKVFNRAFQIAGKIKCINLSNHKNYQEIFLNRNKL